MLLLPILPCEGAKIAPATLRKYRKFVKRLPEFAKVRAYWLSDRVAAATPEGVEAKSIRVDALELSRNTVLAIHTHGRVI